MLVAIPIEIKLAPAVFEKRAETDVIITWATRFVGLAKVAIVEQCFGFVENSGVIFFD